MRLLVTGADGFVGRYLVERLASAGHEVAAGCRPGTPPVDWGAGHITVIPLELTEDRSVRAAVEFAPDGVIHLAAIASNREADADPGQAWTVNAVGTARLAEALGRRQQAGTGNARLLVISSGEVYGAGVAAPRRETDPVAPISPYAASKAAGEIAALEVGRRTGLEVVVARPFTHTGPRQETRFVLPTFAKKLREAKASGAREVATGNLDPVRDLLDVRDVVEAYILLLRSGRAGEIYNVASGQGSSVRELFVALAKVLGVPAEPRTDPALARAGDIPHLVGDSTKLRQATGWAPSRTLEQTLRGLVDAQAD